MAQITAHNTEIDGRPLRLTNLEKVLYPATGFTKADLIDYYIRVAPAMLPHLRGRPITFKRYPNGVEQPFFFEKNCASHRPSWVRTAKVTYNDGSTIEHCLIEDRATLAWAANLGAIELHTSLAYADRIGQPTMIVFDLDPGEGVGLRECGRVALVLRDLLEGLKLRTVVKASGGKGLHVYLPLNTQVGYEQTRPFAHAMAKMVQQAMGDAVITKMSRAERAGRVFIDWSQNTLHKTTVCVYAMRAVREPAVSRPLDWAEVQELASQRREGWLDCSPEAALRAVREHGDRFEGALQWRQRLTNA
ncbi:MAG: non-homologous end-joining DNA ligase [Phycisphaeraceae bacterium]